MKLAPIGAVVSRSFVNPQLNAKTKKGENYSNSPTFGAKLVGFGCEQVDGFIAKFVLPAILVVAGGIMGAMSSSVHQEMLQVEQECAKVEAEVTPKTDITKQRNLYAKRERLYQESKYLSMFGISLMSPALIALLANSVRRMLPKRYLF